MTIQRKTNFPSSKLSVILYLTVATLSSYINKLLINSINHRKTTLNKEFIAKKQEIFFQILFKASMSMVNWNSIIWSIRNGEWSHAFSWGIVIKEANFEKSRFMVKIKLCLSQQKELLEIRTDYPYDSQEYGSAHRELGDQAWIFPAGISPKGQVL